MQSTFHDSGCGEREMSFCGSLPHGLGSHVSPTSSHWPREKVQDEISLALGCVPWGRGGASQGKLHLALSQRIQTHSFGPQRWAETSLLEARTSQRLSGLWVTVLDRVFQGLLDQGWGGGCGLLEPVHGLFQGPARAQAVSLLVALWGSKTPLRSPWHRVPEATAPRRCFCSWFNAKLLSLRAKQRTSYSATRLTSLFKGLSF